VCGVDLAVMLAGWVVVKRICVSWEKSVVVSGAGKRGGGGWCGEQTNGVAVCDEQGERTV
jgi:hypothetical protein